MTRAPTGSYLRIYFSMEVIKIPQRHPNLRKPLDILTIPKAKLNSALKMKGTEKLPETKAKLKQYKQYSPFRNTLQL